jgi:hypothetical protein
MLKHFDFEKEISWVYDPHGLIFARRSTYKHESREIVEKTTNLEFWEEVKEIFKKEAPSSMTVSSHSSLIPVFKSLKFPFLDPQSKTRINGHHRNKLKEVDQEEEEY